MQISSLLRVRALFNRRTDEDIIFVMGCGRSGTHWLGYILQSHPQLAVGIEARGIFDLATKLALDPTGNANLFPRLVRRYRRAARRCAPNIYADKSHPTMWFAEALAGAFPRGRFIGIQRSPYATVSSMVRHPGVTRWTTMWRSWPLPNRFLGISHELADKYDDLSLAEKHAYRWCAHVRRLEELQQILGTRMLLIHYEDIHKDHGNELNRLRQHLGLSVDFPPPDIKSGSLARWQHDLAEEDVVAIGRVLKRNGFAVDALVDG